MKEEEYSFIRQTSMSLSPQKRALLIRTGNTLFNDGKIQEAKRIFLTVNYHNGIKRVGDYYLEKKDFVEASKMYQASSSKTSLTKLAKEMAESLRYWIRE